MAKTSSFATHFALFGQNTRRQTQMAYQQAAQDIQQTQASQLAQREMLVQMLKGEQDYLRALRKDLRDLDKSFVNLNVNDGLRFKLTTAVNQLGTVYASMSKEDLSSIQKTEERLEKRFTIDPSLDSAIKNWARAIDDNNQTFTQKNKTQDTFNVQYGFDPSSSISKPWLNVQNVFTQLDNPDSKAVGLEAIAKIIEDHSDGIYSLDDTTPVSTHIKESLSKHLQFKERLDPTKANEQKESELSKAKQRLKPRERTAVAINDRLHKTLKELDTLGEGNPEVQARIDGLKTNMDNLSDEIAASKKLVTGYREQLQKDPAELPSIRERAGEILLQQDAAKAFAKQQKKAIKEQANQDMLAAMEGQPSEDEELLKYLSLAPDFKEDKTNAEKENAYFKTWVETLNKDDSGNIQSYFANINKQGTRFSSQQKDYYKTAATKRMMDAVNKQSAPANEFKKALSSTTKAPEAPAVETNSYVVQKGETLSEIAKKIGVPVKDLMKQNNIKNARNLRRGATLKWK